MAVRSLVVWVAALVASAGMGSAELGLAPFTVPLVGRVSRSLTGSPSPMRRRSQYETPLGIWNHLDDGSDYVAEIQVGGQKMLVLIDTGGGDLVIVQKGYKCFEEGTPTVTPADPSWCNFTNLYDPKASPNYEHVPGVNFNLSFTPTKFFVGTMARETVEVAGLKITDQLIGVANQTAFAADGVITGIMGLGYSVETFQHNGTDPTKDHYSPTSDPAHNNWMPYDTLMMEVAKQGLTKEPVYSLAHDRPPFEAQYNGSGGFSAGQLGTLGLGGVVDVPTTKKCVTADILSFYEYQGQTLYGYIQVANVTLSVNGKQGVNVTAVFDNGTPLNYVPAPTVKQFAAAAVPAGTVDADGAYELNCNATVPNLAVTINGVTFDNPDPRDQVVPRFREFDPAAPSCYSGTQEGGSHSILGGTFLHTVVMSVDVAAHQVTFCARKPY